MLLFEYDNLLSLYTAKSKKQCYDKDRL